MHLRTSVQDSIHFAFCGVLPPTGIVFSSRVPVSQVVSRPEDRMNHEVLQEPQKEKDYNHLAISEMKMFQQFKGMERHHQQDAVAAELKRGTLLKSYAFKEGAEKFASRYGKSDSRK